ncbi:hypothetical protein RSOLAG1IB_11603 [Rhizoctonia solani AG-1 IB]|uniref:Transmembrane protein n=1 Tax=Thanatephorus cucumeris (strain AG1-IB / isolate 7/3/14) TaxID=1108050 RepID=A0A0B7F9J5_THACB|nr:hypothetical protein RSOLAG1IB_11603 [Rhizoctonia solani AG-1 IB]
MDARPPPYDPNPDPEEKIRIALRALQELFDKRTEARNRRDQDQVALIDGEIAQAMRLVGDVYEDENTREHWYGQARNLENANAEEREHILMPIAKGLGLLIAAPLALAFGIVGGAVFTAGAILYGVGRVVGGVGSLLTAGIFR